VTAAFLPDVRSDQPTSTVEVQRNKEVQPTKSSSAKQEVPESVTGLEPEELDVDYGTSSIDNTNQEGPTESEETEEILNSDAVTTGSENESPSSRRQRPTRATRRPTRFQDIEFETQFQPGKRKRKCNKLNKKNQTGSNNRNVEDDVKRTDMRFRSGGEVKQKFIQDVRSPTGSRSASSDQDRSATRRLTSRACLCVEDRPVKRKWKSLPKIGGPTRYKTHFLQQPSRAMNRCELEFKAHKYLANCSQQTRYEQSTGNGNQATSTVLQHPPVNVKDLRNRSPASTPSTYIKSLTDAHHRVSSRREMPDAVKGNTAAGVSDNDLINGRAAVVNYYNQYRDDRAIEASAPLIGRHTSAKDNREVAPPIQLGTANATIEESGITDSNATSAETEIKTSEIDKLFPRSIAEGPDSRNSHNGIKKYFNDNYQPTAQQKNRRVDKTRQKASTNYKKICQWIKPSALLAWAYLEGGRGGRGPPNHPRNFCSVKVPVA